ncbi:MAG: hypothetical protein LUC90_11595 [Lachnospiraceae bacterium]|nr:hypothetical protein [Lachnospiraceae bacterium]
MASSWWLIEEKEMAFKEGEAKGEVKGEARGEIKGERRMAELFRRLNEAGRSEDAMRATTDREYHRGLYEEFGI